MTRQQGVDTVYAVYKLNVWRYLMSRSKRVRKAKMFHKRIRKLHRFLTRFDRAAKKCAGELIDGMTCLQAMIDACGAYGSKVICRGYSKYCKNHCTGRLPHEKTDRCGHCEFDTNAKCVEIEDDKEASDTGSN